jgi:hypothetical protein
MMAAKRIVCSGNVMHWVVDYKVGADGYVDCMRPEAEHHSQPAAPFFATPHPDPTVHRSELFAINYVRFRGEVTEEFA